MLHYATEGVQLYLPASSRGKLRIEIMTDTNKTPRYEVQIERANFDLETWLTYATKAEAIRAAKRATTLAEDRRVFVHDNKDGVDIYSATL